MLIDEQQVKGIVQVLASIGIGGAAFSKWWARGFRETERALWDRINSLDEKNQKLSDRLLICETHRAELAVKLSTVDEKLAEIQIELRGYRGDLT